MLHASEIYASEGKIEAKRYGTQIDWLTHSGKRVRAFKQESWYLDSEVIDTYLWFSTDPRFISAKKSIH